MKGFLQRLFGRPVPSHDAALDEACPIALDAELEQHKTRLVELERRLVILEDELQVSRKGGTTWSGPKKS